VRVILCRLDARIERPEERDFRIADLKYYLAEHRRSLVAAAITILRAYYLAGRSEQRLTPWGGFDDWSGTVRAALVWLGLPDPCGTRQYVIGDDPDREAAAAVLAAWHAAVGSEPVRIGTVVDRSETNADLRSALLSVCAAKAQAHHVDSRRLSWWCREWRGRVVNSLRLDRAKDFGTHATWFVHAVADSAVSADILCPKNSQPASVQDEGPISRQEDNGNNGNNGKTDQHDLGIKTNRISFADDSEVL
jgi:hypothetical protein